MATAQSCSICNKNLSCSADKSCWCTQLPNILSPNPTESCLCPNCLLDAIATKINTEILQLTAHQKAQIAHLGIPNPAEQGKDYYMDRGLLVMTKWYLLRRGSCCGNGCRHCPYG